MEASSSSTIFSNLSLVEGYKSSEDGVGNKEPRSTEEQSYLCKRDTDFLEERLCSDDLPNSQHIKHMSLHRIS